MKQIKILNAIFCENVVAGLGGKFTLVNVLSGDVIPSAYPANLPIALFIEIGPIPNLKGPIKLVIRLDGDLAAIMEAQLTGHNPGEPSILATPTLPLTVPQPALLTVDLETEGFKTIQVISKNILSAPAPSV